MDDKQCPFCAETIKAAAIKCRFCGSDLTAGDLPTLSAPRREKPPERNLSTIRVLGGIVAAVFILIFVVPWFTGASSSTTSTVPTPPAPAAPLPADPQPASDSPAAAPERPILKVDASKLYGDYEANEVATNQSIGNAIVEVSGLISSIDENFTHDVVIHLFTGNEYESAGLTLSNPDRSKVAELRKGEQTTIRCLKMMRLLGSPQGSNCTIVTSENGRSVMAAQSSSATNDPEVEAPPAPDARATKSTWAAQIQARIQREWIRPPSAHAGIDCTAYVTQAPGGDVTNVKIGACNGDEAMRQSIQDAAYRASPLPNPPDPSMFERNLEITFRLDASEPPGVGSAPADKLPSPGSPAIDDYAEKMNQKRVCGNDPYLARVTTSNELACTTVSNTLRTDVLSAGLPCDRVLMAMPAIRDSTVSEVGCVVHGGDVIFGKITNLTFYMVSGKRVTRLPVDGAQAVVDAAISRAVALGLETPEPDAL